MTNLFGFVVGCASGWFARKYWRIVKDSFIAKKLIKEGERLIKEDERLRKEDDASKP